MKEIEFHTFNCGSFHVAQCEFQPAMTHISPTSAGLTEVKGVVAATPFYHSVTATLYLKPALTSAAAAAVGPVNH